MPDVLAMRRGISLEKNEGKKFIDGQQFLISDLRLKILTELLPQIFDQREASVIRGEIDVFDQEYEDFRTTIDFFGGLNDLSVTKGEFADKFKDWLVRLEDIKEEASKYIDNN